MIQVVSEKQLKEACVDHIMEDIGRDGIEQALDLADLFDCDQWDYEHKLWR